MSIYFAKREQLISLESTACVMDVMCFWCSSLTGVLGGVAISGVVDDVGAAHTATRKYHPFAFCIISLHLQAAQEDAAADVVNAPLLV